LENKENIVIIGCGASGGTAAQFARKTNRKSNIIILEKGKYPQYSKCGIPYVISGIIPEKNDLIEFSEEWFKKANIQLSLKTIVEKIDTKKQLIIAKKEEKRIEIKYDKLIFATGAKPFVPPIQNLKEDNKIIKGVYSLRTINDLEKILSTIKKSKKAVVIGAGFIGLETAENLYKKNIETVVIEALDHIMPNSFDIDMSKVLKEKIPKDLEILTNHLATRINKNHDKIKSIIAKNKKTNEETEIHTDFIVLATGVKPDVKLAKEAGCEIGDAGGIKVNNKSETNIKNIYAAGDCTEYYDYITAKPKTIGLGSTAVRQAIAAGINSSGGTYILPKGFLSTYTSEFFNVEIAGVGPSQKDLNEFDIVNAKYNGLSHPHYFPGGKPITIKILVDKPTGMIAGAQAIGDKAAQRINTIACAILGEMDIETFRKLETAYAPPVSPTLEAETIVCDIISKKLKKI